MSNPKIQFDFKRSLKIEGDNWLRIVEKLGEGGNGVVYLALGTSGTINGHLYAIKMLKKIDSDARRKKFHKEVKFLKLNNHPSIIPYRGFGGLKQDCPTTRVKHHIPFFVTDYLPFTMSDVIKEKNISTAEKSAYIVQLLSALDHLSSLHSAVIHRDIKPKNIFIKGKTWLLGDFGLMTRDTPDHANLRGVLSESKNPAIPYKYRTPDLIAFEKNGNTLTPASDIFQLGLVAAELFTGENPLVPTHNILDDIELKRIGSIPSSLGGSINSLISRMLELDPKNRPTPKELLDPWREVFWVAAKMEINTNNRAM